ALGAGAALVQAVALLYAAPTVLRATGVPELAAACERMLGPLAPGGPAAGWAGALLAVTMPALAAVGLARAGRNSRRFRIEPGLGRHEVRGPYELVVLPTPAPLAVAVDGAVPQVVISEGLVDVLSPAELAAVLRHEAAHLAHGHRRYLLLATALDAAFALLPFARRSTAALRAALERWADEAAATGDRESRAAVRDALLGVTWAAVGPGVAAFSAAETVVERLDALDGDPPRPSRYRRAVLYVPTVGVTASALVILGAWGAQAQSVVAMAGRCPV
ncbi:MAG: M56 family metallopeptidase, partial [Haloechinothrix sp.]